MVASWGISTPRKRRPTIWGSSFSSVSSRSLLVASTSESCSSASSELAATRTSIGTSPFAPLTELFTGSSAIAYSDDPVAAARVAVTYAKGNDKLVVVGGALAGEPLDAAGVKTLAELPSLDVLRAELIGMLNTPATRIAGILQAPAGQLARVINAYSEKGEAA